MSVDAIGSINPSLTPSDPSADKRQQVAIAAREFEAMFLLQMLKQMRQSMLAEDEKEAGLGADTMVDTIDAELSRHLAGQPGGLSDVIAKALGGRSLESVGPSPASSEGHSKVLGTVVGSLSKAESPAIALPPPTVRKCLLRRKARSCFPGPRADMATLSSFGTRVGRRRGRPTSRSWMFAREIR